MVNLDRILVSYEWEITFPLSIVSSLTRVGSDYTPIVLDLGVNHISRHKYFFFEKQWRLIEGFKDKVFQK